MDDRHEALERLFEERIAQTSAAQMVSWGTAGPARAFTLRLEEARARLVQYERESQNANVSDEVRASGRQLPRGERVRLAQAVDDYLDRMELAGLEIDEQWGDVEGDEPGGELPFEHRLIVGRLLIGEDRLELDAANLAAQVQDLEQMGYVDALLGDRMRERASPLLLDALLIASYGAFEDLLSSLVRFQLQVTDSTGDSDDEHAIDVKQLVRSAEDAINGGPEKWRAHLIREVRFDPGDLVPDWDLLVELHLRRNKVVHLGGRVDGRYLKGLPQSLPRPLPGEQLITTVDYLRSTLDRLLAVGAGMATLWPLLIVPDQAITLDRPNSLVVSLLKAGAWAEAECVAITFSRFVEDEHDRAALRVNEWMARRERTGGLDSIADEVRAWVPPSDRRSWEVARAALLADGPSVVALLKQERKEGKDLSTYRGWPLLSQLARSHPSLQYLLGGQQPRPRKVARRRGGT